MIFLPEANSMASAATHGPAVNCSHHAADSGAADVAFTAGVITVAAAFCVISVVSLCHCVRHALAGGARKAAPLDAMFYTEDEVEMAELRHFPLPHTGQVPRVRTPPSPSPSPMKFLLSPPEARLSQTHLMSSRAIASDRSATGRETARLTRSLPSLHTLPGGWAAHGAVEHYVEMALVSAMTASSTHELETLAPEPDHIEPLVTPAPPPPALPPRDSSSRGRRRLQRKKYPRTPLPRGALVAAVSAPPAPSHGTVDTDYQSAYAPSQITDSDEQTKPTKAASTAARSAGSKAAARRTSTAAERPAGRGADGRPVPGREGSELILVSRRALERLLRRPLTAAELHVGGPDGHRDPNRDRAREQGISGDRDRAREQGINRDRDRAREQGVNRDQDRARDDTLYLSGLQPMESTAGVNENSRAIRSETAGALADTEDTLGDTVGTLGETGPLGNTVETLEGTVTLGATDETFGNTAGTLDDTIGTLEDTAETLRDTAGAAEEQRMGWIPQPPSPEWDPSAEPRPRQLPPALLAVSPRSHSVV